MLRNLQTPRGNTKGLRVVTWNFLTIGVALLFLNGCDRLRISPQRITLRLDQSVAFSAALPSVDEHALNKATIRWSAYNLRTRRPAAITDSGLFTAQLPGDFVIVARVGKTAGAALVHVPRGLSRDPTEAPLQTTPVSWRAPTNSRAPRLAQPPITGPGWRDDNYPSAFYIENRRGHGLRSLGVSVTTRSLARGLQSIPIPGNSDSCKWCTGKGNYVLTIPILSLLARGSTMALKLTYNGQLWTELCDSWSPSGCSRWAMVFDHDHGWPAPGWSLGFGKVVQMGSSAAALEDADGAVHPFAGSISAYSIDNLANVHTTDGTLIDGTFSLSPERCLDGGFAKYPNGTTIYFGAASGDCSSEGGAIYPMAIVDPNGNTTSIAYVNDQGPAIQTIQDTLGRVIEFHYDSQQHLTTITAPGWQGQDRTIARFHYSVLNVNYNFYPSNPAAPLWNPNPQKIDGILLPDSTGYWFGDDDSYSPYGMIAKVSQRRGMSFDGGGLNDQGVLKSGVMTREQVYDYPKDLSGDMLNGPPTYSQITESWARMDTAPAATHYAQNFLYNSDPYCQSQVGPSGSMDIQVVSPDGSINHTLMNNDRNSFDYGLPYCEVTANQDGKVLRKVVTHWELGDYDSPRVFSREVHNANDQIVTTRYSYDGPGSTSTNQLFEIQQLDYDGKTILRRTNIFPETDPGYSNRHIFNLSRAIVVHDTQGKELSRTEYLYDHQPLTETPGVENHLNAFDPQAPPLQMGGNTIQRCTYQSDASGHRIPDCEDVTIPVTIKPVYDPATEYRGNITTITRYTAAPTHEGPIAENRRYDITGNLLSVMGPCCEQVTYAYTAKYQFAFPETITKGSPDPQSQLRMSESYVYDFATGLLRTYTDANNLITTRTYDPVTLRLSSITLPTLPTSATSATITYSYDDEAISSTIDIRDAAGSLAGRTIITLNGLGKSTETRTLSQKNTWNAVAAQYDAMGRRYRQSQRFAIGQQPLWNEFTFDSLGRTINTKSADGNQTFAFYNETARPNSASTLPGETVRTQDAMGRERWSRTDALGNLTEVVEPNAYSGNGSVSAPGSVRTVYSYNALGLLTKSIQGPDQQERDFAYDSLGRMTADYLVEKSRTLDDGGNYAGTNGKWSDVFSYDDRSNLVWHADARGIKTVYDYENDPLDRLQAIAYDTSRFGDAANPVLPAPPVYLSYVPDGDVTRVAHIAIAQSGGSAQTLPRKAAVLTSPDTWALETFTYDDHARVASKTLSYPGLDLPNLAVNYEYDSLNRLARLAYPREHGTPTAERKIIDYTYCLGQLNDLKIDGAEQASGLAYNPAGQLNSVNIGPSGNLQTSETYDYDSATSLLTHQEVLRGNAPLLDLRYTYFGNRQLQQAIDGSPGQGINYAYAYDNLGRIGSAQASNPSGSLWSESYAFDTYGNKLSVAASGHTLDGTPIPLDGVAGSPTPPNGLASLSYDTKTNHIITTGFAYDAAGNQTRVQRLDGSWFRYQYDAAGRLARVTDDSGKILESYQYGPDRHRFVTTSGSGANPPKYYVWDRDHVLAEYTQPGKSTLAWSKSISYLGNRVLATFAPSGSNELVQYQHPDRLGTHLVTDGENLTTTVQTTLPFGTLIPNASDDPVNPVFTSYDRSPSLGLDYAINRQYDSEERFSQPDPLGIRSARISNPETLNLYAYAKNDPVNALDQSGLQASGGTPDAGTSGSGTGELEGWITFGQGVIGVLTGSGWGAVIGAGNLVKGDLQLSRSQDPSLFYTEQAGLAYGTMGGDPAGYSVLVMGNLTVSSTVSIGTTVSIDHQFVSSDLTYVTTITAQSGAFSPSQQTTIMATDHPDGSSTTVIISPDGTQTTTQTAADGTQTRTVTNPDGSQTVTTTPPDPTPGLGNSGPSGGTCNSKGGTCPAQPQ